MKRSGRNQNAVVAALLLLLSACTTLESRQAAAEKRIAEAIASGERQELIEALYLAGAWGLTDRMKEALARGADPNGRSSSGYPVLYGPAMDNKPEALRLLLEAGADRAAAFKQPGWGRPTALEYAQALGYQEIVAVLSGPQIVASVPKTPALSPARVASDVDDLPAAKSPARRDAYAVVIGVGKYRQKLPDADFADMDARLVSRYLTRVMGYQDANVATLVNDEATKGDFEKYFDQWLPNRVEKDAKVLVYYSGHGAPNPETGDAYLVPYDGDPTYLKQTGYQLKSLYEALSQLPTRDISVIVDSCFSGAGGRSILAKGARPLVNVRMGGVVPSNIRVLSASASDQISHAYEAQRHGLFTYFLLKGIKEQAGTGPVDMKKVFDYAAPQVSNIARRDYNSDQVPQWREGE